MNEQKKCNCGRPLHPNENKCPNCRNKIGGYIATGGQVIMAIIPIVVSIVAFAIKNKNKE